MHVHRDRDRDMDGGESFYLDKLLDPTQLEHLLELVQEEDLLGGIGPRPEAHQAVDDWNDGFRVLLHVL
jgi:hypothetical protein